MLSFISAIATQQYTDLRVDIIALVSIAAVVVRSFLAYSNALTRYDLLVNRFITSKLTARGTGVIEYVTREAGVQRARRAELALAQMQAQSISKEGHCQSTISGKAIEDLLRLGLVRRNTVANSEQEATELLTPQSKLTSALESHWRGILHSKVATWPTVG